jgi:hypothetical protein
LSLGDKIQILGKLCPNFLRALSATVDAKFAELDAAAVRRKASAGLWLMAACLLA